MGSLRIVDDKIDSGNYTSHDKYLGISSSMGYFANKNFALSFLVSIQKDDNRSSQLYGLGFLYYLENFYIGAQFGAGRIGLDDDPKAFMFVSFPIGALVKLVEHVYFDIGFRVTWNFGEEDLTVTTMEAGWMGFQIIF
ncbi:hypothetical protein KKF34_00005 [Myxococcota bacterium]|nr:hypothetical protein [Myxococcota bacterium]MBU1495242.1 hypothetical protein [Myxococcota bacterium]